jgi:acyl-CoA dehydrogenase
MLAATPFGLSPVGERLLAEAQKVADDVAGPHADEVDRDARFPHEAIGALREARLLGAYVPVELGGESATIGDLAAICHALGQRCSATAMVYAMHQIQVSCLVHHGQGVASLRTYIESVATQQRLLASATTEVGVGGDVRTSLCAVDLTAERFTLRKETPVISYGDHADDILVTARRSPEAAPSDQVIVAVDKADAVLVQTHGWDTMGMRGTCSNGYTLTATGSADRVLPQPYADISSQTMLPVSHIVWAALWLGIATDAVNIARTNLRAQARKSAGEIPTSASDVAVLFADLEMVKATVASAVDLYASRFDDPLAVTAPGVVVRMNALKTSVSGAVVRIIQGALQVCGIAAYRNDSPLALGRHLRDAHSASLMVHNERILLNNGRLLCVYKGD